MLPKNKQVSYDEFLKLDNPEENLEYINGNIYLLSAPSVIHQAIVTNLSTEFGIYFKGKACSHFVSPFDVVFKNEEDINRVQPDITVICDKKGLNDKNYTGVPALVVEVLSPSTASKDYIQKMDLYMRFGVKEYWIISPKNKKLDIFYLDGDKYTEPIKYSEKDIVKSIVFEDLEIDMTNIFR